MLLSRRISLRCGFLNHMPPGPDSCGQSPHCFPRRLHFPSNSRPGWKRRGPTSPPDSQKSPRFWGKHQPRAGSGASTLPGWSQTSVPSTFANCSQVPHAERGFNQHLNWAHIATGRARTPMLCTPRCRGKPGVKSSRVLFLCAAGFPARQWLLAQFAAAPLSKCMQHLVPSCASPRGRRTRNLGIQHIDMPCRKKGFFTAPIPAPRYGHDWWNFTPESFSASTSDGIRQEGE